MSLSKRKKSYSRSFHFRQIFKNSPSPLRKGYWLVTTALDLMGFILIFLVLSSFYAYLSLYLVGFWLRQFSLIVFFFVLSILGFLFHTKVTLSLLTFFYKCYDRMKKGK